MHDNIKHKFVKYVNHVYPVYDLEFEINYRILFNSLKHLDRFTSLGRQGLFAHDNTHHTIKTAYKASEC